MEGLNEDKVSKEICDLKHKSVDDRIAELEDAIDEINRAGGRLDVLRHDLEKKIEQQDSKVNGLIMAIVTTVTGTIIAVGTEFIKKVIG